MLSRECLVSALIPGNSIFIIARGKGGGSKVLYWAHFKGIKKNVFLDSAQAFLDSEGSLAASVIDNLKFVIKIHCH